MSLITILSILDTLITLGSQLSKTDEMTREFAELRRKVRLGLVEQANTPSPPNVVDSPQPPSVPDKGIVNLREPDTPSTVPSGVHPPTSMNVLNTPSPRAG